MVLTFYAVLGSPSKKYWTSTFSTSAIRTIVAALMRLCHLNLLERYPKRIGNIGLT